MGNGRGRRGQGVRPEGSAVLGTAGQAMRANHLRSVVPEETSTLRLTGFGTDVQRTDPDLRAGVVRNSPASAYMSSYLYHQYYVYIVANQTVKPGLNWPDRSTDGWLPPFGACVRGAWRAVLGDHQGPCTLGQAPGTLDPAPMGKGCAHYCGQLASPGVVSCPHIQAFGVGCGCPATGEGGQGPGNVAECGVLCATSDKVGYVN